MTSPPLSPVSVDSSQFSGYSDFNVSLQEDVSSSGQDPAQMKALELLGKTAYQNGGRVTAREAAAIHYEARKMEKLQRKESQKRALKSPLLLKKPSKIAETTRKVKVVQEEEGIETVHEMKCQLELDREATAKKKALRLLELGLM